LSSSWNIINNVKTTNDSKRWQVKYLWHAVESGRTDNCLTFSQESWKIHHYAYHQTQSWAHILCL
jgi:hypothetical protein